MFFQRTTIYRMRYFCLAAEVTTRYVVMLFAAVDTVGKVTGALGMVMNRQAAVVASRFVNVGTVYGIFYIVKIIIEIRNYIV